MLKTNQELQQGRYRVIKHLSQGKITSFYQVHDNVSETNVLLKETLFDTGSGESNEETEIKKKAFTENAKFFCEIKHDGFLQILDCFSDAEARYLVMESVDGKNVGEFIKNSNKLISPANVLDWGKQILDALDYLHKKTPPVVYFNLKPANLYRTSDEKIKLLTTGIAATDGALRKIKKQAFDNANLNYSPIEVIWEKLDPASQRVILNGYDAKSEQNLSQPPDARSDIYSLAATLYHLLTGKLPLNALERSIELLEDNDDPLSAPNEINSDVSVELSDVLIKALSIKRENRFQSALEMREELENVYVLLREQKIRELQNKKFGSSADLSAAANPTAQTNQNLTYEKPQINAEESKQLEAIKQKLREAEEQKLVAERRAAEAERRLTELEKQKPEDEDILELSKLPDFEFDVLNIPKTVKTQTVEKVVQQKDIVEKELSEEKNATAKDDLFEEFGYMFGEPPKDNKFIKRMAVAAIGIIILGGGIWGGLTFLSASDIPNQETLNQTVSAVEPIPAEPQPSVEATPETTPEIIETQIAEESPEINETITETPQKTAPVKQKTPVPQIAAAKPRAERKPAENAENNKQVTVDDLINDAPKKKKKVTVDDLINDN